MILLALLLTELRPFAKPCGLALAVAYLSACCALDLRAQADFQVDTNLVVLHVTVADHQGKMIRNLQAGAFHVYEDGALQNVALFRHEDTPVAVGLVVDNSGSMRRKLPDVVAGASAFARSSNPEDQMFVVNFNENVSLGLPPDRAFVSSPDELKAAMLEIHAKGETALYDAVATALDHIHQSPLQKKVLIVLSDGGDNASKRRVPEVLASIERSDVVVYTVGLFDEYDTDRNPGVLRRLAKESGGEAFFPRELPDVTSVLQAVSRDIRNQYTIGYVPTNEKRDGTYRDVRVRLTAPHADRWIVHTRMGYFAVGPDSGASDTAKAKERRRDPNGGRFCERVAGLCNDRVWLRRENSSDETAQLSNWKDECHRTDLGIVLLTAAWHKKAPVATAEPPVPVSAATPAPASPPPAPAKLSISSFTVEPSTIQRRPSATLPWSVSNATDISVDQGAAAVPGTARRQLSPTSSAAYTLSARRQGGADSRSATVTGAIPPPPLQSPGRPARLKFWLRKFATSTLTLTSPISVGRAADCQE